MKQCYPIYGRFALESTYNALPKSEREIIRDFVSYCSMTAAKRKQDDIQRSIVQFRDTIEKPIQDITIADLRGFLMLLNQSKRKEYTRNGIKIHVRRFLKWRFKDWSDRFEEFRDIKLRNGFNEERINEGTLLRKDQIEAIIKRERDFVCKAFFVTLYESGLRPKELRTLRWKSVHLNSEDDLSELHIFATKTGKARTVFVKEATFYLRRLFETKDSEYVFPAIEDKTKPMTKVTAHRWIRGMGIAIGLHVFPYLLRHTRAHELYSQLPSKVAQKFMGHNSDMSELYAHISSKDIKDSVLKTVYHFDELPAQRKHELEIKVEILTRKLDAFVEQFPKIARILARNPTILQVESALKSRRSKSDSN